MTVFNLLRTFLNALRPEAGDWLEAPAFGIVQEDDTVLVLNGNGRQLVVNKRHRTVKAGAKVLTPFDAVETIDVVHRRADEDHPDRWSVRLNLKGTFSTVSIGETGDDADASVIAAKLSRFTGKRVRAF
jgi:hypothetical protein